MLDDLDRTIEALLKQEMDKNLVRQLDLKFQAPDQQFAAGVNRTTINFFLYDVRENRELRSNEPVMETGPKNTVVWQYSLAPSLCGRPNHSSAGIRSG